MPLIKRCPCGGRPKACTSDDGYWHYIACPDCGDQAPMTSMPLRAQQHWNAGERGMAEQNARVLLREKDKL